MFSKDYETSTSMTTISYYFPGNDNIITDGKKKQKQSKVTFILKLTTVCSIKPNNKITYS